jgi:Dolichyl-phosphate-mannose-protein mannosyltransferase
MAADTRTAAARPLARVAWRPVLVVTGLLVVIELAFASGYGYHRDELYFREAGRHLAWGFVDQPPLTPLLGRLSTLVFGDTLRGLRVVPALLLGAIVVVGALVARELGGDRRAQVFSAAAIAGSGGILFLGHQLTTPLVDVLAWLVIVLLVLRLLHTGDHRWWLAVGLAAGIGLENKHLVLLLLVGLLAGLVAARRIDLLRSWWLVGGVGLAVVLWLPNLLWQADHGWPQIELGQHIAEEEGGENRATALPLQLLLLSPFYAVWLVRGWRWLWADRDGRVLAVAYLVVLGLILISGGKGYYAVGLLVVLLVAGIVATGERLRGLHVGLIAASAAIGAVVAFPVLPIETYADSPLGEVNDDVLEMWGWEDPFLTDVSTAVGTVAPEDRDRIVIITANYGEAGAIDRYGPAAGLPEVYSGHNGYADFRRPTEDDPVPVLVGFRPGPYVDERFTGCEPVVFVDRDTTVDNEEAGVPILVCDGITRPWAQLWDDLRHIS